VNQLDQGISTPSDLGLKALLSEESAAIKEAHFAGASGNEIVQRRTALIDRVLREAYGRCAKNGVMPALIAVGGYGRGELHPYSDIDLLFLCKSEEERTRSPELLYLLWDAGLDIGYSVRTVKECADLAKQDIKIRTSLLESRLIAGAPEFYHAFLQTLESEVFFWSPSSFIQEKISERNAIRHKFGGSIYLREPNLKEGTGGLRDIHTAFWIAFVRFKILSLRDLIDKRVITEEKYSVFLRSRNFLWNVRNELHYLSGRKNDHLTFDLQEQAARDFRYRDSAHLLAVERFMKAYFIHARIIKEFSNIIAEAVLPKSRPWFQRTAQIGPFSLAGKTLVVKTEALVSGHIDQIMSAFQIVQTRHATLSDALKSLIRSCRIDDHARSSSKTSAVFLEMLDKPDNLSDTLTLMKDLRFLGRYLPEFRAVQALARHDYYHMYAVDEHILLAIRNLELLWSGRFPLVPLRQAFAGIRKRWLLMLTVLLHDLGKAYRTGHEQRGVEIAEFILSRLGVKGDDRERILFLIENHTVMSSLSQRRELTDRNVIAGFARLVKDRENLAMLYLLTYADISAVNPGAWTQWKASLLQELYVKTLTHFDSKQIAAEELQVKLSHATAKIKKAAEQLFTEPEIDSFLQSMPDQYILHASPSRVLDHLRMTQSLPRENLSLRYRHYPDKGYTELTICAYDAYGMFYRTAGTIAAKNLNILRAQVYTSKNGVMIDTFQITDSHGNLYAYDDAWESILVELRRALMTGSVPPEPGLYTGVRQLPGSIIPAVDFDNDSSDAFTIIDITARDMVGFLYRVSKALFELNLDIGSAKIVTEGARAMDAFYVTDMLHKKITDNARLDKIKTALRRVIE
jgi:[protein-PII] uridylyltransferase